MAGYSIIYVIGGQGGFEGADGVNPIQLMILVGDGNRRWLEPRYFDDSLKPIGKLRTLVPEAPDHPDYLLDACIGFLPQAFEDCPSFKDVELKVGKADFLDFTDIPKETFLAWNKLREEARSIFMNINIWRAELVPYNKF